MLVTFDDARAGVIAEVPVVTPNCTDVGGNATLSFPNPFGTPADAVQFQPVDPEACAGYAHAGFEPGPVAALGSATAEVSFTVVGLGATACYYQAEFQRPDPEFSGRVQRKWSFVKFDVNQCGVEAGFASANDASITCSLDGDLIPSSAVFTGGSMASGSYAMTQPGCAYAPLQGTTTFTGPTTWHESVAPFTAAMPAEQRVGLPAGCIVSVDAEDSPLDVPALITHLGCSRSSYLSLEAALGNVPAGVAQPMQITNPLSGEVKDATLRLPQASGFAFASPCASDLCAVTVAPAGAQAMLEVERGAHTALLLLEHGDGFQITGYGAYYEADDVALDVGATFDLGTAERGAAVVERDVAVFSGEPITHLAINDISGRIGLNVTALEALGATCGADGCALNQSATEGFAIPLTCDGNVGELGGATAMLHATTTRFPEDASSTYTLDLHLACTLVPAGGGGDDGPTDDADGPVSYYACATSSQGAGGPALVAIAGVLVVLRRRRRR